MATMGRHFQPMPTSINHTLRMTEVRKRSWERAIVTPMVLVAFLLQIFIVQTHVHFPTLAAPAIGHAVSAPSAAHHQAKKIGDTSTGHCPWCQAVLANGNYLPPVAPPVDLPVAFRLLDPIVLNTSTVAIASSHAWQSRGPPA
jgi:hypothetical protein